MKEKYRLVLRSTPIVNMVMVEGWTTMLLISTSHSIMAVNEIEMEGTIGHVAKAIVTVTGYEFESETVLVCSTTRSPLIDRKP